MSKLSDNFLRFLLEKHKLTGKNDFVLTDYMDFNEYEDAIIELSNRGVITKTNDIVGTIIVNYPEKK